MQPTSAHGMGRAELLLRGLSFIVGALSTLGMTDVFAHAAPFKAFRSRQ
jgi:hypothetical protein